MKVTKTTLEGFLVIEPVCFQDERGFFLETYQSERYRRAGITDEFVQDNQSRSARSILRGLHFQVLHPQAQIVTVMRGRIYDVCVDLRAMSNTFGQSFGVELSDNGGPRQVYMAPGFAHGFCVLSQRADLHYKASRLYDGTDEGGLFWGDPDLRINWPVNRPIINDRDAEFPKLSELSVDMLPHVEYLEY